MSRPARSQYDQPRRRAKAADRACCPALLVDARGERPHAITRRPKKGPTLKSLLYVFRCPDQTGSGTVARLAGSAAREMRTVIMILARLADQPGELVERLAPPSCRATMFVNCS